MMRFILRHYKRLIVFIIMKRFILSDYEGCQVPRSAVGKLETQESEWCSSSLNAQAENQRATGASSSVNPKEREDLHPSSNDSQAERVNSPLLNLLFY